MARMIKQNIGPFTPRKESCKWVTTDQQSQATEQRIQRNFYRLQLPSMGDFHCSSVAWKKWVKIRLLSIPNLQETS